MCVCMYVYVYVYVWQLPLACVNSLLFSAVLYPMTGFKSSAEAFLFFYLGMTLTTINGLFIAQVHTHIHTYIHS